MWFFAGVVGFLLLLLATAVGYIFFGTNALLVGLPLAVAVAIVLVIFGFGLFSIFGKLK